MVVLWILNSQVEGNKMLGPKVVLRQEEVTMLLLLLWRQAGPAGILS